MGGPGGSVHCGLFFPLLQAQGCGKGLLLCAPHWPPPVLSPFLPVPSSKARINFSEGETQVLQTHLTLKTQEPEKNKGVEYWERQPLFQSQPPEARGQGAI